MINIRTKCFETNSSSCHSLILCTENDYQKWVNGEIYLDVYCEDFVTEDEAKEKDENFPYPKDYNSWDGWNVYDAEGNWIAERRFITFKEYQDLIEYEHFEETMRTPKGEKVIAFGWFGHDG